MVNNILIVPKLTKIEYDMRRFNKSNNQLLNLYKKHGLDPKRVISSHYRQKHNFDLLKSKIKGATIIARDDLSNIITEKFDLVIAFGGDNHFQYVAHFLNSTPILGINSDPKYSDGALTSNLDLKNIGKLTKEKIITEKWPRLRATINKKRIKNLAVSEIFVGESLRVLMSRQIITFKGNTEMQKGSGMIISTPIGISGWFNSVSQTKKSIFSKRKKECRFILCEPHHPIDSNLKIDNGLLKKGDKLKIQSLNDAHGVVVIDSWHSYDIDEGETVTIELSDPLNVMTI